ncbi:MAG TPA: amino acid deaminase [Marmoricola sp.]|nr:amino acid deaminase [Marmoricola sp.]
MRPEPRVVLPSDKGMPAWVVGLPLAEVVARRPRLHTGGFPWPVLTADADALEHNIAAMAAYVAEHDALLCPHGKTTMSPELVARQLDAGAWGITAATVSQVRTFRSFNVQRILLANELVDPVGLDWVLAELERDPGFDFYAYVDSPAGLDAVRDALGRRSGTRPLQLLVELGVAGGRTGCRSVADAVAMARAVDDLPGARLAGVAGYEGVLGHEPDPASAVRGYLRDVRRVVEQVAELQDELIVTAGGSAWFDLVAEELGPEATGGRTALVLRSGCYVTHDHGLYAASGPSARGVGPALWPALRLWGQVLSVPEPGLALAGFGRRDCSFDAGLPVALERLAGDGAQEPVTGVRVVDLNDQHAFLRHDGGLQVGDVLSFGISHPCTTFDKWPLIPVVDDELTVTDCLTTWF